MLGALAYMAWGPSFTGSALKGCRPEGAVVRMAGSKWVNEDDPEMSHPSGLYVLPLKPAKKTESYTYTWKKNEKGELEEYAGYVKAGGSIAGRGGGRNRGRVGSSAASCLRVKA